MVTIDVVVVNWNTRALCATLLRQLAPLVLDGERVFAGAGEVAGAQATVTVVDNASDDGSVAAIGRSFPWARVVASERNLGYAAALELGLAASEAERAARRDAADGSDGGGRRGAPGERLALLLNSDVELPVLGVVRRLIATLIADSGCGLVGPALVLPDGRFQQGAGGWGPGLAVAGAHFLGLSRLVPGVRGLYLRQDRWTGRGAPLAVGWLCGAALLARREALERIGGLPREHFLYGEDLRLGQLLRDAGYRVLYEPRARAIHHQGGAQGGEPSARWVEATLAELGRDAGPRRRRALQRTVRAGLRLRGAAYGAAAALTRSPGLARRAERMRRYAAAAARFRWATGEPGQGSRWRPGGAEPWAPGERPDRRGARA